MTASVAPLEREHELAELDAFLEGTAAGSGRLLLVEGPAGIGKTLLVREVARRAPAHGVRVCPSRGGELERDFGFGIVRQLFEPVTAGASSELFAGAAAHAARVFAADPGAYGPEPSHAVLHGLYWLTVNLAQAGPGVLLVDDVQWADGPSLRFLIHLALRLEGLPIGIAVASRTDDPATREDLQRTLRAQAGSPVLRPQPLSTAATAELVASSLGAEPAGALSSACHEATGGNPFLLVELLAELRAAGSGGRGPDPDRVRRLGPERIASSLLMRIGQAGPGATTLARAAAVLGARAHIDDAADVGGIDRSRAREVVALLRDAAIVEREEPVRFVHPIVRSAIYEDIPAVERTDLHRRAGQVLAGQKAEPEAVAVHLLAAEAGNDPLFVPTLSAAARAAAGRGAPETAARYLRRALREPLADADSVGVLLELGSTEREYGSPDAAGHLREAALLAEDPHARAAAAYALGWVTGPAPDRQRELVALYESAADAVRDHDRELALRIEGRRLEALLLAPGAAQRFEAEAARFTDLPGETPAEAVLLALCARKVMLDAGSAADAADLAVRAVSRLDLAAPGAHSIWLAATVVWLPGESGLAQALERRLDDVIVTAGRAGLANVFAWSSHVRAFVRGHTGDLRGAEADARAALASDGMAGAFPDAPVSPLVAALAEQGKVTEAQDLLRERGLAGEIPHFYPFTALLIARARMYEVAGDATAACADLDEAFRRLQQSGGGGVAFLDAQFEAATVRLALGDREAAVRLADHALELAQVWGAERAVGGALRVAGLAHGGPAGLGMLEEATTLLARSPARVWHAQVLLDLGAALRRTGALVRARDVLAEARDLAHRCGAVPVVDRAHQELLAAGARPRRIARSGADALTPSERRVADLAAGGMTNKEIAQALFVTLRTVELHLTSTYRKLGIDNRSDLRQALA